MHYPQRTETLGGGTIVLDAAAQSALAEYDLKPEKLTRIIQDLRSWHEKTEHAKTAQKEATAQGEDFVRQVFSGEELRRQWDGCAAICTVISKKLAGKIRMTPVPQRPALTEAAAQIRQLHDACVAEAGDLDGQISVLRRRLEE